MDNKQKAWRVIQGLEDESELTGAERADLRDWFCRQCKGEMFELNEMGEIEHNPHHFCSMTCQAKWVKKQREGAHLRVEAFLEKQLAKGVDIRRYLGQRWDIPLEGLMGTLPVRLDNPQLEAIIARYRKQVGWRPGWDVPNKRA